MIKISIDLRDVERGLEKLHAAGRNLGPAMRELKPVVRADQREHAAAQQGPTGGWQARSLSTLATRRHRRLSRKILGRLPMAVAYTSTLSSVIAESRVGWSDIHQEGGIAGHHARIPARPFLWFSDAVLDRASDGVAKYLVNAFGGF